MHNSSAGAAFRLGVAGFQRRRTAWNLHKHARMLVSNFLLTYLVTAYELPLQWEEIDPVGRGPPARYRHASATLDSVQGALFVFGG